MPRDLYEPPPPPVRRLSRRALLGLARGTDYDGATTLVRARDYGRASWRASSGPAG